MKINNSGVNAAQTSALQAKDLDKNLKSSSDNSSTSAMMDNVSSSQVQMSPDAKAFQKAKALASAGSIDEAKVARLQKLIDAGEYKVDAAALSDRLVDEQLLAGE